MIIYEIRGIIAQTYYLAASPSNIIAVFKFCGICPFNRDIFQEHDYMPSSITDRPLITTHDDDMTTDNIENQNHNLALYRPIMPENHNTGPNEPAISPSTLDGPVLTDDDNPDHSARAMTPQDLITCPMPGASFQNQAPKESIVIPYPSGIRTSLIVSPQVLKPIPKAPPLKQQF